MQYVYDYLIQTIWIIWIVYWRVTAGNVKSNARVESVASRISHSIPLFAGFLIIACPNLHGGVFFTKCWPQTIFTFWGGVLILLIGFGLGMWARVVLGRNWSNEVTVKENHDLIQSGPYARIRHPIYTGLLLGFLGTAIAMSEWRGFLAFVLVLIAFSIKLRLEERWMNEIFGPKYAAYCQRTGSLLPKLG